MKKIISVLLCILVVCSTFIGCDTPTDTNIDREYTTEGKVTKLVADETATGELNVSYYLGNDYLRSAVSKFHELYPNVTLNIDTAENETFNDYRTKLEAKIMAGDGADLFWLGSGFDIEKMMKAGAFADMFEYFENDKNFNIADHNKNVFCAGQPKGRQFLINTAYVVPFVMTTEKIANKNNFDVSSFTDYLTIFDKLERIASKDKTTTLLNSPLIPSCFPTHSGIEWIDYSTGKINVNNEDFKKSCELLKNLFPSEASSGSLEIESFEKRVLALKNEKAFFADFIGLPSGYAQAIQLMLHYDEKPILFTWKNVRGKITASTMECFAVSNNSKNKQNAYNFLKILLSPVMKTDTGDYSGCIPVSNIALNELFENITVKDDINNSYVIDPETNQTVASSPPPQEYIDQYMSMLNDVDSIDYYGMAEEYLMDIMQPYFNDEKSYEECIKEAQSTLEIYVSE